MDRVRAEAVTQFQHLGRAYAAQLARAIRLDLATEDGERLEQELAWWAEQVPEILALAARRKDGTVLARWPAAGARRGESLPPGPSIRVDAPVTDGSAVIGAVELRLSLKRVTAQFRRFQVRFVLLWAALILVVSLVAVATGLHVGRTARALATMADRVAAGDFSARAGPGPAELGQLARALNRMAEKLKRTFQALEAARREADASNRAKSLFLASMSHEIRTPMNAVLGMNELLLETELTPQQREYAETIRSSGKMLLTLIDDILNYTKIESGHLELEAIPFDLEEPTAGAVRAVLPSARTKGLRVQFILSPALALRRRGDPVRIRQVVGNLVNNAVKFTQQGKVLVRVEPGQVLDGPHAVRWEVVDTGIGIAPDTMARLFRPFTQADASTTRRFGGTGLGLAMCARLVEAMGGKIGADSKPGQGSRFWFELALPPVAAPAAEAPELRRRRLLVVSPDPTARAALLAHARRFGLAARARPRARAAWKLLRAAGQRRRAFEVVVLADRLPELTAREFAAALRRADRTLRLVGLFPQPPRHRAARFGLDAFLVEPVFRLDFRAALAAVLGLAAETPQAPAPRRGGPPPRTSRPLRILLAEDNPVNQKFARRVLEKQGYRVDLARDGQEAAAAAARHPYDVILMDCQMPVMDGFEATRRIRAQEGQNRHTPIVALTANALAGDRERCLAAGMDDYLSKPFQPRDLLAKVSQWSAARRGLS